MQMPSSGKNTKAVISQNCSTNFCKIGVKFPKNCSCKHMWKGTKT